MIIMNKQKISAEEKHYIKLNNKLHKQVNELKVINTQLVDKNKLLEIEKNSLQYTVEQQKDWIERLCDCVKMTPEAFKLWAESISKQVENERIKQENLQFVKDFLKKSTNLFNL